MKPFPTFFATLRAHRFDALAAPLLMGLEVACDLAQPWCLSRVVDRGIGHGDFQLALHYALLMVALALTGAATGVGCMFFSTRASAGFGSDLRNRLYAACLKLSFVDQSRFPPSTLLNRLSSDVTQLQNIVLILLRIMVRAPLSTIGGIAMILVMDPLLGAQFLWPLPVLAIALVFVIARSFPLFAKVQVKLDAMATVVRENLAGVRVVKVFVRHREEIARFKAASVSLAEGSIAAQRIVGGTLPLIQLLLNLSMVALVWFGGARELSGRIPLGELMAMVNYLTQILFSLMMSAMMLMVVTRGKTSMERVCEILTAADRGDPASREPSGSDLVTDSVQQGGVGLEFRSVSFRYPGAGADSLSDLSFSLEPGRTLGVLGPTGAGKSTLIALILRFSDPTGGQVLGDGTDLRELDAVRWRRRIGWVPQSATLFSGTVAQNIAWGDPQASQEEIDLAMDLAQARFVRALPEGSDSLVGQRGVNLSGGQKQRLSIARALVRRPSLLILDDSTSALDGRTERDLREALREALPGTTRIVVAQRIASVADADRILLLDQGKVAGLGTHGELLDANELYRDIWRSQMGAHEVLR